MGLLKDLYSPTILTASVQVGKDLEFSFSIVSKGLKSQKVRQPGYSTLVSTVCP